MSTPTRKGLRPEEVGALVSELFPLLEGARIEKVFDRDRSTFLLRLRTRTGRRHLLLSTRPGFSRFHLVEEVGTLPSTLGDATVELRSQLRGARLASADQPGGDRIARIRLEWGKAAAPTRAVDLVIEMFGRSGRLVVVEADSRTLRFSHGRPGSAVGERYRFPDPPERGPGRKSDDTWTIPFEPRALVPEELRDSDAPFHRFLELRMADEEARDDRSTRRRDILSRLSRDAKRRRRLEGKLAEDIEHAAEWERWQREGELLKGHLQEIRRGLLSVDVTNWYDPDAPSLTIALDPKLGPTENIERLFRRARRGKRTLEPLRQRQLLVEEELEQIAALREAIAACDPEAVEAELIAVDAAQEWLRGRERKRPARGATRKQSAPQRKGPKRFRTREGLEILAGRNARENDELSIRVARGNDLFFHRADRPGPHVILRVPRGRNASPESIDDAAFVAAYLSGWRGPIEALVHWTEAKNVRKPKGSPPGRVLVHRTREHVVEYDSDRISSLAPPAGIVPPAPR